MWGNPTDCANITGALVTDAQMAQAQNILDSVTNRTPAVSGSIAPRDLVWLKRALCYQAAWQLGQFDLFTRSDVDGVNQDGVTAKNNSRTANFLAPLAARTLKNVSWLKGKSLRMQTPFVDRSGAATDPMIDDTIWNWQMMSFVDDPGFSTPWWGK
jgi:hypothetical protein